MKIKQNKLMKATLLLGALVAPWVSATSNDIVISQVYGGGGNSGAVYINDYIELFNRSTVSVNLNGWSVQYASSTGTSWTNKTNIRANNGCTETDNNSPDFVASVPAPRNLSSATTACSSGNTINLSVSTNGASETAQTISFSLSRLFIL